MPIDAEDLPPRLDALERDLTARRFGYRYHRATIAAAQARSGACAKRRSGLSMAMKDDAKSLSFVEDTAVRAGEAARLHRSVPGDRPAARHDGRRLRARVGRLPARAAGGQPEDRGGRAHVRGASRRRVADLVLEFGGALSGEHGDGLVRSPFMEKMFGPVLYEAFRQIKRTFDPDGLFNPGKIVDAPPLTSNLRYGAGYRTPQPATFFDYCDYGGMAGAVEMCSGLGVCRKTLDGTMCPSYMATREEAHSTRGRANVLRLAMAGRLGESGLGDDGRPGGAGSLPGVPRLQGRVSGRRRRRAVQERVSRRLLEAARHAAARAPARAHSQAVALGQPARAAVESLARSAPARWINERVLGLDRRRVPPAWTNRTVCDASFARRARGGRRRRCFFSTTRSRTTTIPASAWRALDVLETLGYSVALAPNVCCGRPLISQGLLDEARQLAQMQHRRAVSARPNADSPLVFFEPSCLSAVREDVPVASPRRGAARARASPTRRCCSRNSSSASVRPAAHVCALERGRARSCCTGTVIRKRWACSPPAKALLERIPGATVVDLDAGCCGMAGSFGYARDHFDVSRAIGERRLLPAARASRGGRRARRERRVLPPSGRGFHRRRARCIRPSFLKSLMPEPA